MVIKTQVFTNFPNLESYRKHILVLKFSTLHSQVLAYTCTVQVPAGSPGIGGIMGRPEGAEKLLVGRGAMILALGVNPLLVELVIGKLLLGIPDFARGTIEMSTQGST